MDKNAEILQRYDRQTSDRTTVEGMWEAIARFIMPYRGSFFTDNSTEGSVDWFRNREVYDSTAIMSHQSLSASLHGALTSPSIRWFDLQFRDKKLNRVKAALTWLQGAGEQVHYALQDSNFNLEVNETYQDITGFGTGVIVLEEADGAANEWNGLQFSSVPLKEAFFETDYMGRCARFYRALMWTPQQILTKFGDDVPQSILDLDEKGSTERVEVVFYIIPRNNKIVPVGTKVAPSRRPWEYGYILRSSAESLGKPGGYYEMPVFIPRWRKTSESMWGNSPAMVALADVLSLNSARKMQLVAAEKMIDPPIFAEERSLISDLDMSARGLSVVRSIAGIKAFESAGRIDVSDHMIDQLQAAIRNYFFMDQLSFPDVQNQPMTATEAQIRYEQMQRLLGPTLGRLQSDLLDPIVARVFRMLARDGVIEQPPQAVIDADAEFDIEYMGSMVRSQRVDAAASIERLIGSVGGMAEVFPEMLDNIDAGAVVQQLGRDLNVPATILRSTEEVAKIQKQRQEQQAAAEQAMIEEQQGLAQQAQGQGQQAMQEASNGP